MTYIGNSNPIPINPLAEGTQYLKPGLRCAPCFKREVTAWVLHTPGYVCPVCGTPVPDPMPDYAK